MNSFESLQRAIIAKWNSNVWLSANTHGLYFNAAPKQTEYPYAVFFLDSTADHDFSGYAQNYNLQFNIFSAAPSSEVISDILDNIKIAFNKSTLTLTGYTNTKPPIIVSENLFLNDSEHWQGVLIFNLRIRSK